jgi:hypothetical protein
VLVCRSVEGAGFDSNRLIAHPFRRPLAWITGRDD